MSDLAMTLAAPPDLLPLTALQLRARLIAIQDVQRSVMVAEVDFGVVPGTQKPSLYKPGAEKLAVTFLLTIDDPIVDDIPTEGHIRYRVRVPIRAADGRLLAVGIGECQTGEEKYAWRRPVHVKEYDAAPLDRRREKWQADGDVWLQVRTNPADLANTVLKMAHKRAYIHGVIMATAAGAIFTQDLEDLPPGVGGVDGATPGPVAGKPVAVVRKPAAVATAGTTVTVPLASVTSEQKISGAGKAFTKYTITAGDGQTYGTITAAHADVAREAQAAGLPVLLTYVVSKFGRDVTAVREAPAAPEPAR